jgi:ABC-2 type transport system permease protein
VDLIFAKTEYQIIMKSQKRIQSLLRLVILLAIVVVLNILGAFVYGKIDLTEDKRFTLTKATNRLLGSLEKDTAAITIELLLDGEIPSDFRHLQNSVKDMLDLFRERSGGMINYRFINPLNGTDEEVQAMQEKLAKQKIIPLQITERRQGRLILVYPTAIIRLGDRFKIIDLVELGSDNRYSPADIDISINFLEYKFASAIQKLKMTSKPVIAFLNNHGELPRPLTIEFEKSLSEYYGTKRVNLSRLNQLDSTVDLVIIAKPRGPFSYDDKFKLDQYIMNGGKVLWMMDPLNMEDDSLRNPKGFYVPLERPVDMQKMLFDYGARVNTNIVASYDAASFMEGIRTGQNQTLNPKWFYYPLAYPYQTPLEAQESGKSAIDHPIVKNLDFVLMHYPASIDTVLTKTPVKKIPLLRTSKYSKVQFPPARIGLELMDPAIKEDAFTKGNQNVAVLLEGEFSSHFRNRVPPEARRKWETAGNYPILEQSKPTKMIVVSDGDIAKNRVLPSSGQPLPMGAGYHPDYGPRKFANKEFLMNAVEYLLDDSGLIGARSREIKLRPLDQKRAFAEEGLWQFINLGIPLLILLVFGIIYNILRRRRFAQKHQR